MFFDKIYCINLDARTDRWEESTDEFNRIGWKVERFPGSTKSFNHAQSACLKACKGSSLILEDDCEFKEMGHLEDALKALPKDWDIVSLGATLLSKHSEKVHPNLYRYKDGWATQAVGYSQKMLSWLNANFDPMNGTIYDEWLRLNVLPFFKCYIVKPMIVYQRPSFSDIRKHFVDHTKGFEDSEKLFI
jgi:GR25 family glycosyltransferase involved in LPS biosynthesis